MPCDSWAICRGPWTAFMETLQADVDIYAYEHGLCVGDIISWQVLLDEGSKLLAILQDFCHQQAVYMSS